MGQNVLDQPIARGRTAEVYAWETGCILKLFYDWVPPDWMEHEARIGKVISTKDLPTPKLINICTVQGRNGIVYERVDGPSMLRLMGSKPWQIAGLARQLAEVQSRIHSQNGNGLPEMRAKLGRSIQQQEDKLADLKDKVYDALDRLPDGEALCHFDLHPDQVMMSASGPVVIDWSNACQGDPLGDVARSVLMLKVGEPLDASPGMLLLARLARGIFRRTYLKKYLALHPAAQVERINAWLVPVAAARINEKLPGELPHLLRLIREAKG